MKKKSKDNLIKMSELAEAAGVRYSTVKFYSEQGILPYEQKGDRLVRRYDKEGSLKRLNKIRKLKDKRLSIDEIKKYFRK